VRAGRRFTGNVVLHGSTLYGGGTDRRVYAVDLTSGDVLWSTRLSGIIGGGVLLSGDTIFVANSRPQGQVQALSTLKGKRIWRVSTDPVSAPLAMIGKMLIVETQRGVVMALDPATGVVRWRRRVGTARGPAVAAGSGGLLVSTTDSLFRLSLTDGKVTHRLPSPGTVVVPWLPHSGSLVAGTADSQVVSIRPADLRSNWTLAVDAPVLGSPATMGDTLFVATKIGSVYRVDLRPEPRANRIATLAWPVTSPVTVAGGEILLGGADGTIRALRTDGTESWRVRVRRPVELGPVPLPDGLLAIGGNGDLHRYRR
jgi:outer membrane protein assembly factor BamB